MYQNVRKSSLLSQIVKYNVTLFIKGLNYLEKRLVLFSKKMNI